MASTRLARPAHRPRWIRRALLDREVPDRLTWWHTLGSATLTVFVVQVVTGVVLATFYSPAPDHAYDSIQTISSANGRRAARCCAAIHHWGASAMVVLVLAHMVRVFSMGAYKYPREANWVLGVVLFFLVMGFGFTGYLLPWDQKRVLGDAGRHEHRRHDAAHWSGAREAAQGRDLARRRDAHPILRLSRPLAPAAVRVDRAPAPGAGHSSGHRAATQALEEGAPRRTTDPAYPEYYTAAYAATKRGGVRFWPDIICEGHCRVARRGVGAPAARAGLRGTARATRRSDGHVVRPSPRVVLPSFLISSSSCSRVDGEHDRRRGAAAPGDCATRPAVLRPQQPTQSAAPATRPCCADRAARWLRVSPRRGHP